MPYGNSIPIKNAGRVMEKFVKIVVPRGTQSTYMTSGGALAGVDGHQNGASKYQQSGYSSNNSSSTSSSGSDWKQHAWAQN